MAIEFLAVGFEEAGRKIARIPQDIKRGAERGLLGAGILVAGEVRRKFQGYAAGRSGHEDLQTRSGALRASVNSSGVEHDSLGSKVRVGYRKGRVDAYARLQEEGGTVTARGRLLAIPLPAALTPTGVLRKGTTGGRWLDQYPEGFWFTSRRGNPIFAIREGGELVPIAYGRQSVTIRAHRMLERTKKENERRIVDMVSAQISRALRSA